MKGFLRAHPGWARRDRAIAAIAARQKGLVRLEQLQQLGLSHGAIEHRVRAGRLHRIHRRVYAVGHPNLGREQRWLAAVYAAWPEAVLSDRSAARLWGARLPAFELVEVTTPTGRRPGPGILAHHRLLSPAETTDRRGIPVTSPLRTVMDVAAVAGQAEAAQTFRALELERRITAQMLDKAVRERPRHRGNAALRALLSTSDTAVGSPAARSRPTSQPSFAVTDSRSPSETPWSRSARSRSKPTSCGDTPESSSSWMAASSTTAAPPSSGIANAAAHGWRVIRVTWRQLHRDGAQLARDLRAILARAPANP